MPSTLPIIGYPLADTLLEGVLRRALTQTGSQIEIQRWERRPHQLAAALAEIRSGEAFAGALVASPHKEKAAPLSDWLSDDARLSGAVSLVVRLDGRLRGHNTDTDGIRAGLASILPAARGRWPRNAVVLGAGGGARAVVAVLIDSGFHHVAVLNRHLHRAEALVAHFSRTARNMELRARPWHDAIIEAELGRAELLVNASGLGTERAESPIRIELIPGERYLLDLALAPVSTPLIDAVVAGGGRASTGHLPFLASMASAMELLSGSPAEADLLRGALETEVGASVEGPSVVGD